jgi:hypothetical protein
MTRARASWSLIPLSLALAATYGRPGASVTEAGGFSLSTPTSTGGGATLPLTMRSPRPTSDAFGTHNIYPDVPRGRTWRAKWDTSPRTLHAGQRDPLDPEFTLRGSNHTLQIMGDGTAKSSGEIIRLYVGEPGRTWLNTELTLYARRVSEQTDADNAAGFEFQSRTADGHIGSSPQENTLGMDPRCEGHSYTSSFRYDGRALVQKELKHPTYTSQVSKKIWGSGGLPRNQWVGIKYITFNLPNGGVKMELWRDLTDGANGGSWEKVLEYTDAGNWSIDAEVAATCGIPADFRITTPQPLFIIRNDNIVEQWYKKATLREIQPPAP